MNRMPWEPLPYEVPAFLKRDKNNVAPFMREASPANNPQQNAPCPALPWEPKF